MDKRLNSQEEKLLAALAGETTLPDEIPTTVFAQLQEVLDALNAPQLSATETEMAGQIKSMLDPEAAQHIVQNTGVPVVPENFAGQVIEYMHERSEQEFGELLQALPTLQAPEGFAARITARIQDDLLRTALQQLPTPQVPEGFAQRVVEQIQNDLLSEKLQALPLQQAPEGFAQQVVEQIQDDLLGQTLQALPALQAPEGFAAQVAARIQDDLLGQTLQQMPAPRAPEGFAAQVTARIQDDLLRTALQQLPTPQVPEGFAQRVVEQIQDDLLTEKLQVLKTRAPEGFSQRVLQHIQQQGEQDIKTALTSIPEMKVPAGFAARLMDRMQDEVLQDTLSSLKTEAPEGFADQVVMHIQDQADAGFKTTLQTLPALQAPEGFAAHVASRISRAAHQEAHNPAPLYLVGMALTAAAFFIFTFVLPNMQVGVSILGDLVGNVSELTLGVLLALAVVSGFALLSRVKFAPQLTYAAFAAGLLTLMPSLQSAFGPVAIPPQTEVAQVVRVGGDVVVRGHVTGDVVAVGGDVKLVQGARVDGRTVSILGDVSMDTAATVASAPTAILGRINGKLQGQQPVVASVGVASAFVPLLDLMKSEYWPALYFAFLCVVTLLVYQSGHGIALLRQSLQESNRNLALGYVTLLVTVPLLLLSTLAGNALLLGLGIFLMLGLSAGVSVSLLMLGATFTRRLVRFQHPVVYALMGLTLYLLTLPFPMLASLLWLLGGCYGLGVLLNYIRKTNVAHLKAS